jgi:hypothetical protein
MSMPSTAFEPTIPVFGRAKTFHALDRAVKWSEFLATDPEVPGSISGPTRFSEK